jgi:retron-type reverse transcriptase
MIKATIAQLRLAWERYKRDLKDRSFVDHRVLETLIEQDLSSWLQDIQRKLEDGYNPQPSRSCSVPKPGFMIRPGMTLEPADAVVYTFLVGQIFPLLQTECRGTDGKIDIAYRLSSKSNSKEWTSHDFKIWRQWREKSLRSLKRNVEYVVTTDITGYYDNIPIDKLASELRRIGAPGEVVSLLQRCLQRWSHPRNEGIPQGYTTSDLLAKLYLTPVDKHLQRDGFSHLRYVDDIRIFCSTKLQAKHAIRQLSVLMYFRGLTLQSAKTDILTKAEARTEFDGVTESSIICLCGWEKLVHASLSHTAYRHYRHGRRKQARY